jgi:rhodanese-related sulfurtransferase
MLFIALFLAITPGLSAQETPDLSRPHVIVPEKISGVTTVTAEQLIQMLTSENAPLLIDARIRDDREFGYIESSISLPDIETNCDTLHTVSADKNKPLMFYCNGVQCGRSVVSIKVALSCGYHNLSWFKGGFAEWKDKGYQYIKND